MAESKEKPKLEILKERYKVLQEKYNLPGFEELNKEFAIEKIAELETELLTREIRRFIADKIYNYLRFCETLLNPVNAPMFVFSIIKSLSPEDKKKISDIYSKLSEINFELIKLDLEFSEEEDAEFIKRTYESWKSARKEIESIVKKAKNNDEKKPDSGNNGYFG